MPELKTRMKFKCTSLNESEGFKTWNFTPVYANDDPNHENSKFWKYTPSGKLEVGLNLQEYQGEHPVVGQEYYLDISPVPAPAVADPVTKGQEAA